MKAVIRLKGGAGSGNRGHSGRPGKVGGSQSESYGTDPRKYVGYIDHKPNPYVPGKAFVMLDGIKAGLDTIAGKWQTVCEAHGSIASHTTKSRARSFLPTGSWCEACMAISRGEEPDEY